MKNKFRQVEIEKVTINIGTGIEKEKLERGLKLLQNLTGKKPVKTFAKKRVPTWGVRPGLAVGCRLTLRGNEAKEALRRFLEAKERRLKKDQFDSSGNVSFGIPEYIDIPKMKYDHEVGILGLQVCITFKRPGYRIKHRKIKTKKIPAKERVTKQESIDYLKTNFEVNIV